MFSTVADTVSTCGIISSQEKNTSAVHVLRSSCVSKFVTHWIISSPNIIAILIEIAILF